MAWEIVFGAKRLKIDYDPKPTLAFGILGDTGQINSFATRELRIKKTPESRDFFEHIEIYNVVGDFTRRAHTIHLIHDTKIILFNAQMASITVSKSEYKIILAAWNKELESILSGKLNALDWVDYNLSFVADDKITLYTPPAADSLYIECRYDKATANEIPNAELLPAIHTRAVFDEILSQNGLTLNDLSTKDWINDPFFQKGVFQMTTSKPPITSDFFTASYPGFQNFEGIPDATISFNSYTNSGVDSYFFPLYPLGIPPIFQFIKPRNSFDFKVNVNLSEVGSGVTNVELRVKDEFGVQQRAYNYPWNGNVPFVESIIVEAMPIGWTFYLSIIQDPFMPYSQIRVNSFECTTVGVSEITESGTIYSFKNNLPDIQQIDLLQFFLNAFGLFCDFDSENKTIITTDYQYYINAYNNGDFLDWSDKVCNYQDGIDIDRSGVFAKKNTYKYTNKISPDLFASYDLIFDSENVAETRTAYKAPFGVAPNDSATAFNCIAAYTKPEGDPIEWKSQTMDPFFCIRGDRDVDQDGQFVSFCSNRVTDASIFWEDRLAAQSDFTNQLSTFKTIEIEAKLNDQDIYNATRFDIRFPVLINVDGIVDVFKVNSIEYKADNISIVSLTRLEF